MEQFLSSTLPTAQANNCWRSIGVRGDKSCVALVRYAHCRNCPTYSGIATSLLTREASGDNSADWNERYAAPRQVTDYQDRSVLILRLGTEWFAIATGSLDEVLEPRPVHRLPHRPNPIVLGVTNVRGELVVCVSLERLLGIPAAPVARTNRLLVLRSASGRLAVPVDEVQQTHAYQATEMIAPPETSTRSATSYTNGLLAWQDRMISCLDEVQVIAAFEGCLG